MRNAVIPSGDFVGLSIVRSLGKKNINTTVICENNLAKWASFSKYCNNKIILGNTQDIISNFSEEYIIMPILENQIIELTKKRNRYHCTFAFPEYPVLEMASDKKFVMERAKELDIPCPETIFLGEIDPGSDKFDKITCDLKYPVVIKPVHGGGGEGVSFVHSPDQLKMVYNESTKEFGPVIIQEKIPFNERYSVGILMNFDHEVRRFCVLRELRYYPLDTGPATLVETIERPDLVSYSQRILESMNFYGVAELDFVNDPRTNTPKLLEINPRFWGSLQGAISAGVDFPFLLYRLFEEGDIDKNNKYRTGIRTRHVFFYDYRRLRSILYGNYTREFKKAELIEFLKFYKDDAYYIFDVDDMKPFFSLIAEPVYRRLKKLTDCRKNSDSHPKKLTP